MRKFLLLKFFLLMLFALPAFAQEKLVTGRVTGDGGNPLPGVTVTVKGTSNATSTNVNGEFSIRANSNQSLVFSSVNYNSREISIGNRSNINTSLSLSQKDIEEVVVVAMDQKRKPRELGFSVQKADGEELQQTQRESFVSALQGRVAGLTVNQTAGLAGASSQIVLRGFNSLSLDNSPLFVIDGIVADNQSMHEGGGGASLGLAGDPPSAGRVNDYSNRIGDINPNDIESVTVLKGPEATALYGSQASSGAIIITTKKSKGDKKLRVAYDNSFRLSKYNRMPRTLDVYSGGSNNIPIAQFTAFGPRYTDDVKLYKNINNFFETGFSQTHNLALDFGGKVSSFRLSGSFLNSTSAVPDNKYNRYNIRLSNSTKIGKFIKLDPSISYIRTDNSKPIRGASGYMMALLTWPAFNDISVWEDDNGLKIPIFSSNPNADFDNPFYSVYKNRSFDETDRIFATLGVDITPFDWLTLSGRFGYDTYAQDGYTRYDSMSYSLTRAQKGQLTNYYRDFYGYNHTITATAKKNFGKFSTRLMVGNMWQDYETQQWSVTGTNLSDANGKDSSITDPATRVRLNNNTLKGLPNYSIRRSGAYFGEASVGYNNLIFLTYSHRFEESSIFPKKFRKYDYPAGSVSIIMSDLLGLKSNLMNFWKLRGSLANTARSSAPYANQSVFNINTGSGGGYYYGFTNSNPLLSPEEQQTYEVGSEFRLFNNKLNIDATYYNTTNENLIVENFRASYGTGFVLNTLNVGSNRNEGVEVAINFDVIKNKNFSWNTRFNFNKMWNRVLTLPSNVPEFYIADTWLYGNARGGLVRGGATTTITSYGYKRNDAGQILINPTTGLPVIDANFKVRGDRNPDFTLGWVNTMNLGKRVRLSFLWDLKMGGDIFNATDDFLTGYGRSYRTYDRYVPRVVKGVLEDGLQNTSTPTVNTIAVTPAYNNSYYTTMPEEEFIEKDVNWFRLRDVSLYYSFGKPVMDKLKFVKSLSAFVTITDPVLFTNYSGPDPQSSGLSAGSRGVGGFGFDYGNIGAPLGLNIGLKAKF